MEVHRLICIGCTYWFNDRGEGFSRYRVGSAGRSYTVDNKIHGTVLRFDEFDRFRFDGIRKGIADNAV
ncbi:hypothetical protein D3C81_1788320 [compost metagenome]